MAYSQELQSERFFEQSSVNPADGNSPLANDTGFPRRSPAQSWQRLSSVISLVVGAGAIVCVVALAIPYLASAGSNRPTNVLDWWLRFGGAKPDQTFERFLKDAVESNEREWDEMYQKSPVYQFNQTPLQFQTAPGFNK